MSVLSNNTDTSPMSGAQQTKSYQSYADRARQKSVKLLAWRIVTRGKKFDARLDAFEKRLGRLANWLPTGAFKRPDRHPRARPPFYPSSLHLLVLLQKPLVAREEVVAMKRALVSLERGLIAREKELNANEQLLDQAETLAEAKGYRRPPSIVGNTSPSGPISPRSE